MDDDGDGVGDGSVNGFWLCVEGTNTFSNSPSAAADPVKDDSSNKKPKLSNSNYIFFLILTVTTDI